MMRWRSAWLLVGALGFAACGREGTVHSAVGGPPVAPGEPVAQGSPNTDLRPAFPGQTRAPAAHSGVTVRVESLTNDLEHPWSLAFLPDGHLLVTEKTGQMHLVTRDGDVSAPIAGVPAVDTGGQGGLLDVRPSPTFASDRLVYWSYAEPRGNGANGTSVARGRLSEDGARLEQVQVIFRQLPAWKSRGHFGSRLVFDRDGRLFVTLGDRQGGDSRGLAQDPRVHIGKIVRLNPDGTPPAENPFVTRSGDLPEIWSLGHRNVQGAAIHPQTGELWSLEHGPRGGDELNIARAGRNYGWPVISYGEEYSGFAVGDGITARAGMEQPLYYWDPVIAPGDMIFYRGTLFPWTGDLLIAGLASQGLVRLELDGERVIGEERFGLDARVRDIAESEDGALWVVTDAGDGQLLRLTPQNSEGNSGK